MSTGAVVNLPRPDTATAALDLWRQGWTVIPIPRGEKNPNRKGWDAERLAEEDIPRAFARGENLGVILGEPSGGLADVDLDCPEAVAVAATFLPATGRVHGRPQRPRSHFWYVAPGSRHEDFRDPEGNKVLVELRADGDDGKRHQTVVPPSLHADGPNEILAWESMGEPGRVEVPELRQAVAKVAAAALLARRWPKKGGRDDAALALCGALARSRWDADQIDAFVLTVARAGGDDEWKSRAKGGATVKRLQGGEKVRGLPALAERFGKDVAERVAGWMGLERGERVETGPAFAVVRASTITPSKITWFWPGFIPEGAFVLIEGPPDAGKSMLAIEVCAGLSMGRPLPFGKADTRPRMNVLYLTAEDSQDKTLVPRLAAAGADMERVFVHNVATSDLVLPAGVAMLRALVRELGIKFLVLDALNNYLDASEVKINDDQSVRQALRPLSRMAEEECATVAGLRHLNKKADLPAAMRGAGSVALGAVARSALLVARHPEDHGMRVVVPHKGNLARDEDKVPVAFRITEDDDGSPVCEWLKDPPEISADELLQPKKGPPPEKRDGAEAFLREFLAGGEKRRSEVLAAGEKRGFNPRLLDRAATRMELVKSWDGRSAGWSLYERV